MVLDRAVAERSRTCRSAQAVAVELVGVRMMGTFDYSTEAGLYSAKGTNFRQKGLEYRRFARAAEAIRFAIEDLPASVLGGCALEVDEERYVGRAIRGLYDNVEFPLPRRLKVPM